ncbi:hypothetical protein EOA75_32435 [Mesorhizobium sp. M1A.F.Ca.IN.022.07.1.1]|uniref:hypothetical protein n=1 Tax=Mesorhizobium sp. M1A.F.Ca.IN.022.07.1.1 TaxID=2496767 RepID=UPI000FCAFC5B|nr:hypothetical protein [Mesorhizobium sp. M1A.F.Ca.IN.022.07.1.1]RUV80926.1 hypothetical protein EOA75_32435 [Mesorhizobium sp. M1A.F.Ca.IN.022.07.1.1]TIS71217.1 MAG: hypothetical protein E5X11_01975 [Mesorhizobium sp.]
MSQENKGPGENSRKGHNDDEVVLEIATPNGVFRGSFDKNDKVEKVINEVVMDRDLAEGDAFELYYGDVHLEPVNRPLVSFGLKSGRYKLTLVATGSGV